MKKLVLGVGLIWILAAFFTSCCTPTPSESLPVTLHPQQMSYWCWAASGQMVMDYLGKNVDQCTQANNEFGTSNCCGSPFPGSCNNGGWPEFDKYGFSSVHTSDAPLSWEQVKSEISSSCGKRPFCFTWHWAGGGGHVMTAIGYDSIDGTRRVEVNDPWPPNVGDHYFLSYDSYVSGPSYTHWDDYYMVIIK